MLRIEFHCHTIASPDSLVRPEELLEACRAKGIDRVVITDHNSIAGALEARKLDPQRVIIGEEIYTTRGELLAAFVREEVPPDLPPLETIEILRDQGAFISVSHPFDRTRGGSWALGDLERIAPHVDAIETFNSRCALPAFNRRARDYANRRGLPGTAGSDAHTLDELGNATMLLPEFEGAEGLRKGIGEAEFDVSRGNLLARLGSRYAALSKRLDNQEG